MINRFSGLCSRGGKCMAENFKRGQIQIQEGVIQYTIQENQLPRGGGEHSLPPPPQINPAIVEQQNLGLSRTSIAISSTYMYVYTLSGIYMYMLLTSSEKMELTPDTNGISPTRNRLYRMKQKYNFSISRVACQKFYLVH